MNSAEDRVHAAMSAAADLAAREIPAAPPLRLPSGPAAGSRRRHAPRRWIRWAAPLTAAAAVFALAIALVVIKGAQNGSVVSPNPATSAGPAASAGPGGTPRYYVAVTKEDGIVAGDSVTGKTLAKIAPPTRTTHFKSITAAADDRTFVVLALTYAPRSFQSPAAAAKNATATGSWFEVRLAPGTAHPARLTPLPIKPQTVPASAAIVAFTSALSGSGKELAVTEATASGGLAVKVFSVATGQLLHDWTTSDPSLSQRNSLTQGLSGPPSLTWIDGDQRLALDTRSAAPASKSTHPFLGFGATDIVRELNVAGPASGDLLADSKVVWDVHTWEYPVTLLQSCAWRRSSQLISADGTTLGCTAVTGPGKDPDLSFLSYPLATGPTVAGKESVNYEVTHMGEKGVDTNEVLWISPSGDALIGAWTIYAKGTLKDAASGLHIGVMSRGRFTPLRFPRGFDQEANIATITW